MEGGTGDNVLHRRKTKHSQSLTRQSEMLVKKPHVDRLQVAEPQYKALGDVEGAVVVVSILLMPEICHRDKAVEVAMAGGEPRGIVLHNGQ